MGPVRRSGFRRGTNVRCWRFSDLGYQRRTWDGGWFYETGDAVIFESHTDALAFKVWIGDDPFGLARRIRPQVKEAMTMFEMDWSV